MENVIVNGRGSWSSNIQPFTDNQLSRAGKLLNGVTMTPDNQEVMSGFTLLFLYDNKQSEAISSLQFCGSQVVHLSKYFRSHSNPSWLLRRKHFLSLSLFFFSWMFGARDRVSFSFFALPIPSPAFPNAYSEVDRMTTVFSGLPTLSHKVRARPPSHKS